jgi:hypothetical protein
MLVGTTEILLHTQDAYETFFASLTELLIQPLLFTEGRLHSVFVSRGAQSFLPL